LSEQRRLEINHQLNAIAEEITRETPVASYPAFSAEEFPGELTDRVRPNEVNQVEAEDDERQASEYFLRESSPIHEAPSIDAATAERFRKIGVMCLRDLIRIDVDDAAQRLRHAGITAGMIRSWRAEALLVCRVARLRPYDARILVACGITDPETLASSDPATLWDTVESFCESTEGKRIIRSAKSPDFEEVYHWIQWASHARQLRAA